MSLAKLKKKKRKKEKRERERETLTDTDTWFIVKATDPYTRLELGGGRLSLIHI